MDTLVARAQPRADVLVAIGLKAVLAGMANPRVDLPGAVDGLGRALTGTVHTFLGFTITVQTGLRAVTVTTAAPSAVNGANACLLLLLSPISEPGSSAVFYAADAGAFDDLAASDQWALCSFDPVILDTHLHRV